MLAGRRAREDFSCGCGFCSEIGDGARVPCVYRASWHARTLDLFFTTTRLKKIKKEHVRVPHRPSLFLLLRSVPPVPLPVVSGRTLTRASNLKAKRLTPILADTRLHEPCDHGRSRTYVPPLAAALVRGGDSRRPPSFRTVPVYCAIGSYQVLSSSPQHHVRKHRVGLQEPLARPSTDSPMEIRGAAVQRGGQRGPSLAELQRTGKMPR